MTDDVNKIQIRDDDNEGTGEKVALDPETSHEGQEDQAGEEEIDLEPSFDQGGFEATKNLIQSLSVQLDELTIQQREYKERLSNILENDSQLSELEQTAKDAGDAAKKRKKDLMDSVEAKEVKTKLAELRDESKEIKESLTHHLLNYYQVTGVQSFETPAGDEREFSFSARIKKPKK